MAPIDDLLRDTATQAKQRDASLAAPVAALPGAAKAMLMSIPIGTRVLDLISGEEGVVIDGKRENVVIPIARQPGS
jgi:hypothetical protein